LQRDALRRRIDVDHPELAWMARLLDGRLAPVSRAVQAAPHIDLQGSAIGQLANLAHDGEVGEGPGCARQVHWIEEALHPPAVHPFAGREAVTVSSPQVARPGRRCKGDGVPLSEV